MPDACTHAAQVPESGGGLPRVLGCGPGDARKVQLAWVAAARLAETALRWLLTVARSKARREIWNRSAAHKLFGPFRARHLKRALRVFSGARRRLRSGYGTDTMPRRATVECMPGTGRCGKGLLGNASIYGRIRLCPRLLQRSPDEIAAVVLHEVMHHRLGVGDQRHEECVGDRKHRCYRENAHTLVSADRFDLAVRNIDNFVLFARAIARAK